MEMEMAGKVAVKVSKIAGHIFYSHHLAGQPTHTHTHTHPNPKSN